LSESLSRLLQPHSVAVFGASERLPDFVGTMIQFGFRGEVYPVNPRYQEVHGLKSYATIESVPGPVDYAIFTIPAPAVPEMMDECVKKGVKLAHLYSGRFGETGRAGDAELEREVLRRADNGAIRILGPNCMGLYNPELGMSWTEDFPKESGPVGLAFQSSYSAHDLVLTGASRGLRFSKVIGYGNALDLNECDLLEYLCEDPSTKVILMYVEGVKDGKRFYSDLRRASRVKPVILAKGGRGEPGARAASSHTASLSGSIQTWKAAVCQAGAIPAESFEEMVDLAVTFSFLDRLSGPRVGMVSAGGGIGVMAADQCEEEGLKVVPIPEEMRLALKSKEIGIWDWVGNPVDMSIMPGSVMPGDSLASEVMEIMARSPDFDLIIPIIGELHQKKVQKGLTGEAYMQRFGVGKIGGKPILAVVAEKGLDLGEYDDPASRMMCEIRTRFASARIPVYPTVTRAARAAKAFLEYYARRNEGNRR
jgi:acyl-CoA synthetase (NDP forming)